MKNGKPEPTLDQRVASILTSDDHHPSSALSALISEVDDAIDHADQAGRQAREAAANPKVLDGGALGRALDSEHATHRLRNGLQALKLLEAESIARERLKAFNEAMDDLSAKRDVLAQEFRELCTDGCVACRRAATDERDGLRDRNAQRQCTWARVQKARSH